MWCIFLWKCISSSSSSEHSVVPLLPYNFRDIDPKLSQSVLFCSSALGTAFGKMHVLSCFLLFYVVFWPHWNEWSFGIKALLLGHSSPESKQISHLRPTHLTHTSNQIWPTVVFLLIFLPFTSLHSGPIEMNGFSESEYLCIFIEWHQSLFCCSDWLSRNIQMSLMNCAGEVKSIKYI